MDHPELFMCLIGCKPRGRHIEQHDIFFGIAAGAQELIRQINDFWPDGGRLHLDAWRRVNLVGGVEVQVLHKDVQEIGNGKGIEKENEQLTQHASGVPGRHLYFINLGGYQPGRFEEYHHKLITVQADKASAIKAAKQDEFFREAAGSHVDDQYGVDIDDLYNVEDILPAAVKDKYALVFKDTEKSDALERQPDTLHIGYTKLEQLQKMF